MRAARFHDQGGQFVTQYRGERGPDRGEPFMGDNLRMTEIAGATRRRAARRGFRRCSRRCAPTATASRRAIGAVDGLAATPRSRPGRRRRFEPHVVRARRRRSRAAASTRCGRRARPRRRCTRAGPCTRIPRCRLGERPPAAPMACSTADSTVPAHRGPRRPHRSRSASGRRSRPRIASSRGRGPQGRTACRSA